MKIDAHQHYWRLNRGDYGWLTPEMGALYRDYGPEDLLPHLRRHGIAHTVLVQAADTVAETEYLLALADRNATVAGVVGWVPMDAAEAPDLLAGLAGRPKLRGVRPMIQDIADDDWMLGDALTPAFRAVAELGLTFDALVLPRHLPNLRRLLDRHPDVPVVIDHGAKPRIRDGTFADWAADMAGLASDTQAWCKLSGLATEAASDWSVETLRPYVDLLLDRFGPERLIWGSDWPVVNLAGGYDAWNGATETLLAGLTEAQRAAIFGGNAIRLYGL